jgi:DNA-directed RNA polymerase subunit F
MIINFVLAMSITAISLTFTPFTLASENEEKEKQAEQSAPSNPLIEIIERYNIPKGTEGEQRTFEREFSKAMRPLTKISLLSIEQLEEAKEKLVNLIKNFVLTADNKDILYSLERSRDEVQFWLEKEKHPSSPVPPQFVVEQPLVAQSRYTSPNQYLEATQSEERVFVIGGGHAYGYDYPKNYYLANVSERFKPDGEINITKSQDIPMGFVGKFDVVVWENVDTDQFVKNDTLSNILILLKPDGKLVTNRMVQAMNIPQLKASQTLSSASDVSYYPLTEAPIPFIFYYNEGTRNEEDVVKLGFNEVFKPFLEEKGFKDIKIIESTPYWKSDPDEKFYVATKK